MKRSGVFVAVSLFMVILCVSLLAACGGDGDSPIEITSISEIGIIDTGDSIDVAAYGDYLYYIGWGNTDESFGIVDFRDPLNPRILSTMDVGWAYGVAFDGRYAFVETQGHGTGGFADGTVGVIDCQDPDSPVEVDENDLGHYSAYDVELSGDYLYNFSSNIIGVYDVSTPKAITHVRNVPVSSVQFGRAVGDYLYVGSDYDLVIYDISDPAVMVTEIGRVTVSETTNVYGATASGSTAFASGTVGGKEYIFSVDVSSPSVPAVIGSVETPSLIQYEMRVLGDYLLAVGEDHFVVVDKSDPANLTLVDSVPMSEYGYGFDVSGRYAIVGDDTALRIIQLY